MIPTILQIIGLALTSTGIALLSIPAGVIFAGISFVLIGLALERGK